MMFVPLLATEFISMLLLAFFVLPALSSLPSDSMYAGLKLFPLDESLRSAFGTVSCMLPMEVYLKSTQVHEIIKSYVNVYKKNHINSAATTISRKPTLDHKGCSI